MLRPKFKSCYRACTLAPDLFCLVSETDHTVLEGRLFPLLAPHLSGKNTVEEIIDKLAGSATAIDVHFGLAELEEEGWLDEAGAEPELEQAAVSSIALGGIDAAPLIKLLESMGVVLKPVQEAALTVVLVDDYLNPELRRVSRQEMAAGRPWMMVKPVGQVVSAGPIFHPPKTACWNCLEQRLQETPRGRILNAADAGPAPAKMLPSAFQAAIAIAATETIRWIAHPGNSELEDRILTFDTRRLRFDTHRVVRREGCPGCGEARGDLQPRLPVLRSRKKIFTPDPEAVYRKYQHHISPITGIIDTVQSECASADGVVYVFSAGHNFSLRHDRSPLFGRSLHARSAGKGLSASQARTSALCEALERYSGLFRDTEARLSASSRKLGDRAVHPNACMNFSRAQYDHRDDWNRRESEFNWVPQRFDEEREIEWAPVWSLTNATTRYVPAAYGYYNYPVCPEHDFCRADSNGCAAGASLEEAILQGFLEVVERDCVAAWWYNRLRRPAIELSSFQEPYFEALLERYRNAGRELWVLDVTSDFGIPVFAAVSRGSGGDWILGFGAHLEARLAVSRALAEMNQFLPSALEGRNHPIATGEITGGSFLLPDEKAPPRHCGRFAARRSDDLRDDIESCVQLARERGLEVLVLDQTRADVDLPVVKVIVPGMRQFWARFGPGRLYDVPVTMGWLYRGLREDEMNPAHLVI
jgi:bacteriocin biosynthesis cyclodehydratase domain-containing protein